MLILTIALAITVWVGVGAAAGDSDASGEKSFVKKQLERVANMRNLLANKVGTALQGIIGTIVSFFFRVAAKGVDYKSPLLML